MVVLATVVNAESLLSGTAVVYVNPDTEEPFLEYTFQDQDGIFSVTVNGAETALCEGKTDCNNYNYQLDSLGLTNICSKDSYSNSKLQLVVTDMQNTKYTLNLDKSNGFLTTALSDVAWVEDNNFVQAMVNFGICGSELLKETQKIQEALTEVQDAYNEISGNFATEPNKNNDEIQAKYLGQVKTVLDFLDATGINFDALTKKVGVGTVLDTLFTKINNQGQKLETDLKALETQVMNGEKFACAKEFGEVNCLSLTGLQKQVDDTLDDMQDDFKDLNDDVTAAITINNKDELQDLRLDILKDKSDLEKTIVEINMQIKLLEGATKEFPEIKEVIAVYQNFVTGMNKIVSQYDALLVKVDTALGLSGNGNPPPTPGNTAPTADFTVGSAVVNQAVQFTGTASDANNDPLTYVWNFGDNTATSTVLSPTHTYTATGTYTVTFTVSDGKAAPVVVTKTVTVATQAASTDAQKFKELQARFDKLEKDWFKVEDDYEEAVEDDDDDDIDEAEDDLRELEDDLEELEDDVKDFKKATTDNKLEDNAQDLAEDIDDILDDIDKLLHPEKYEKQSSGSSGYTPSDNSNSYVPPKSPGTGSTGTTSTGKIVTVGEKKQPENVQVQVVDTPVMPQQPIVSTPAVVDEPVEGDFKDSPVYIALVIGLVVILLGLVGFMVAMLMARK